MFISNLIFSTQEINYYYQKLFFVIKFFNLIDLISVVLIFLFKFQFYLDFIHNTKELNSKINYSNISKK